MKENPKNMSCGWFQYWGCNHVDMVYITSVHLMNDCDGHNNLSIDGNGDDHHFKADGRHV